MLALNVKVYLKKDFQVRPVLYVITISAVNLIEIVAGSVAEHVIGQGKRVGAGGVVVAEYKRPQQENFPQSEEQTEPLLEVKPGTKNEKRDPVKVIGNHPRIRGIPQESY